VHASLLPLTAGSNPAPPPGALASCRLDGDEAAWLLVLTEESPGAGYEVEDLFGPVAGTATRAAVTEFDGPRDAAQVAADRRSGRERVWPAAAQVEGTCGAVALRGGDGAMVVVAFAESQAALEAASRAILSTPLLPGEDPALLRGPDRYTACSVVGHGVVEVLRARGATPVTA
jgi:hypothetical protein